MRIDEGTRADIADILDLLAASGLPAARLGEHEPVDLFVARDAARVVGAAALEHHGTDGLLRSVVVDESQRGTGVGAALTVAALDRGRRVGLTSLVLLTETVPDFFTRMGFDRIERTAVSGEMAASEEFAVACPDTAVAMQRIL